MSVCRTAIHTSALFVQHVRALAAIVAAICAAGVCPLPVWGQSNTYPWPQIGNVGIGTQNPGAKLDVQGPAGLATTAILRSGNNTASDTADLDFVSLNGTTNFRLYTTPVNQYTRIRCR